MEQTYLEMFGPYLFEPPMKIKKKYWKFSDNEWEKAFCTECVAFACVITNANSNHHIFSDTFGKIEPNPKTESKCLEP